MASRIAIQPMEQDKYTFQNTKSASAIRELAEAKKTKEGNERIKLSSLTSRDFVEKLSGYSTQSSPLSLISSVISVVVRVNSVNAQIRSACGGYFTFWTTERKKNNIAVSGYNIITRQIGAHLREPHVHRARVGDQAVSPEYLRDQGDVTNLVMSCGDPAKLAWWYYAKHTKSSGWEKMTGLVRPHVPHFVELQVGGFVPRIVYDYWNNKFYATPHYNEIPEKGLENPFIKLSKAHTWGDEEMAEVYNRFDQLLK